MTSQEQCDRMRQVCIDNGLPIWKREKSFDYQKKYGNSFYSTIAPNQKDDVCGFTILFDSEHKHKVSETEFLQLLKEYKDENN
jgi:hypothetical protein